MVTAAMLTGAVLACGVLSAFVHGFQEQYRKGRQARSMIRHHTTR
jgi:hypothetical protein